MFGLGPARIRRLSARVAPAGQKAASGCPFARLLHSAQFRSRSLSLSVRISLFPFFLFLNFHNFLRLDSYYFANIIRLYLFIPRIQGRDINATLATVTSATAFPLLTPTPLPSTRLKPHNPPKKPFCGTRG